LADKEGIIIKGVAGAYTVLADGEQYVCTARGIFRNRNTTPLVGDYVTISITGENIGTLHTIKERKNQLIRPPVANIDQVIITVSYAQPAFNPGLLDRFLVLVEYEDIPVLICVNKSDMRSPSDNPFTPYTNAGYPVIFTSAIGNTGLSDLRAHMAGKTNVFAGPSGVGKSSIINALMPALALETGELSTKLGRGKHTTRHSEIFVIETADKNSGFCVDTPGFTSLETAHIPKNELAYLFREFREFAADCKFSDCRHHNEKSCGVKEQVGGKISSARYESYIKML